MAQQAKLYKLYAYNISLLKQMVFNIERLTAGGPGTPAGPEGPGGPGGPYRMPN